MGRKYSGWSFDKNKDKLGSSVGEEEEVPDFGDWVKRKKIFSYFCWCLHVEEALLEHFYYLNFLLTNFDSIMDVGNNFDLFSISEDILQHRCILLIGPDLLQCSDYPVNEALSQFLQARYGRHIQDVFTREGLFKFSDEKAKRRIQTQGIPEFFQSIKPDSVVLKKLLSIPFHVVLQVTPDTFLSDAAHAYSVKHQFKYFCGGGKPIEPVDMPTTETPLFYNLCGSKDRYDSMVLDFDDLYDYLKSVFAPPGLPQNLRTTLDTANTFLFLGFQLDKWYTQLLIRWISDVTGAERYANHFDLGEKNRDIEDFLRKHLNILTTGTKHFELLDDLYEHFRTNGQLRSLADPVTSNTIVVRRYVQNGDLEKALGAFNQIAEMVGEKNTAIMLLSQYHELRAAQASYALTKDQFWEKSQNIKFRLLDNLDKYAYSL